MSSFSVYVPKDRDSVPEDLRKGSAILMVGRTLQVAARQNAYESFGDVCRLACGRGKPLDPKAVELVEVGFFDEFEGVVKLRPGRDRILASWLGNVPYRNDLEARDSRHNEQTQARRDFRKAVMQGNMGKAATIASRHGIRHW